MVVNYYRAYMLMITGQPPQAHFINEDLTSGSSPEADVGDVYFIKKTKEHLSSHISPRRMPSVRLR